MDAGVAEPARPVQEHYAHEAVPWLLVDASVPTADETGRALQVTLDFVPGCVERLLDLPRVILAAQRPHQGDRL